MGDKGSKTILILGGGIMQIPSVRIARRKGWKIIVTARDFLAEVRALADHVEAIDLRDKEAMVMAAERYRDRFGLDGVFTAGTDFSTTVAWVAEKLGLPGIPYRVALAATDKAKMRAVFKEKGVPCPGFYTVSGVDEWAPKNLSYPLVAKPVDNMGARGVRRVNDSKELEEAVRRAIGQSRTARAIIEEYIPGPELSLDAIVFQGKITVCGVADRHICFPPFFVEMGHTMPAVLAKETLNRAVQVFEKGIRALGIDNGAAKGDIKISPSGPVVGEIAARLSGGYMSGWTFPFSSGVEVTEAAMNVAVGLPPGDLAPKFFDFSAERAFISIPGRVKDIFGLSEAGEIKGIRELFLLTGKGRRVDFPISNIGKCGNVISKYASREEAVTSAEEAVKTIFVRLIPNDERTTEFLLGGNGAGSPAAGSALHGRSGTSASMPPAAFNPSRPELIQKMPSYIGDVKNLGRGEEGISILAIPNLREERSKDWHGLSMQEALNKVREHIRADLLEKPSPAHFNLGKLFWKAFLKGSLQGGVYVIDTLIALKDDPELLKRFLNRPV